MKFQNFLLLLCFLSGGLTIQLNAQDLKFPGLDASPLDAAHYPPSSAFNNYMTGDDKKDLQIKVMYSRPKKKDRVIFGELLPYGQEWRLGANEATEVLFNQEVEIGGKTLNPGYYTMFAEVYPTTWVIKLSTERFIAGTDNRDITKDVVAVAVPLEYVADTRESFTIGFQEVDDNACNMIMEWDRTRAVLPIHFNTPSMARDDASPMDLVQYPANSRTRNYVDEKDFEASAPQIRVVYGRPQKNGRKIFGELQKFGEPWRLGANETTEITFFEDVKIGGQEVKKGRYGLMAIPNADKWDFVLHTNIPSWGTPNHDDATNVATFSAKTEKTPSTVEALAIIFDKKDDKNVHMIIGWDDTMVRVPIEVMKK